MGLLNDDRPAPAHLMESKSGAIPQKIDPVCHLDGCGRPVTRRRRKYCSRHRYLADVDYVRDLWERTDVRAAREAERQLNDLERIAVPIRRVEAVLRDIERATRTLRSFLAGLPAPSRLSSFQREAREAWESFHRGDSAPLDLLIRRHLVRLKSTDGPVPDKLRQRVMDLLDSCFARVAFYSPGDWFLFNQAVWDELYDLVRANLKMTGSLKYILSGDEQSLTANLQEKLPSATALAWQTIQWDGADCRTLINHVEAYLKTEGHEAPKLLGYAEQEPGAFIGDDSDDTLAQFEARETARQQVEALPRLIEKAAFSRSESAVYERDSKVGTEFDTIEEATEAAAHYLGVASETVRTYRFRYRNKLRKAAEL